MFTFICMWWVPTVCYRTLPLSYASEITQEKPINKIKINCYHFFIRGTQHTCHPSHSLFSLFPFKQNEKLNTINEHVPPTAICFENPNEMLLFVFVVVSFSLRSESYMYELKCSDVGAFIKSQISSRAKK